MGIRKLLDDLSDAHLNAWRTQKRINAVERSLNLMHKKQRLKTNLAEHEEEEALGLLADSEAQVAVSGMVNNLLDSVTDQFQAIRAKREAKITADVIGLSVNRLQLITRKYFKTALSVFAAESSIEILHQDRRPFSSRSRGPTPQRSTPGSQSATRTLQRSSPRSTTRRAERPAASTTWTTSSLSGPKSTTRPPSSPSPTLSRQSSAPSRTSGSPPWTSSTTSRSSSSPRSSSTTSSTQAFSTTCPSTAPSKANRQK